MVNVNKYFDLAQLAEASYAYFNVIADVGDALQSAGFSKSQATEFTTNWEVVSGGHLPNTGTGYSGTSNNWGQSKITASKKKWHD